jgi:hypothetical protein
MTKQFLVAYFIFLCPVFVFAQDISGFWKGTLDMNKGCFAVNNIEIQITKIGDSIYGNSYHYLDINNYVKKNSAVLIIGTKTRLLYRKSW